MHGSIAELAHKMRRL